MAHLKLPSRNELREYFEYHDDGKLIRKDIKHKNVVSQEKKWREYYTISFKGKSYRAHRLVYKYHYGDEFDESWVIDHVNGNRHDNRIENLRACTKRTNNWLQGGYLIGNLPVKDRFATIIPSNTEDVKSPPAFFKVALFKKVSYEINSEDYGSDTYENICSGQIRSEREWELKYRILWETKDLNLAQLFTHLYNARRIEIIREKERSFGRRSHPDWYWDHDSYYYARFVDIVLDFDYNPEEVEGIVDKAISEERKDPLFYSGLTQYIWTNFLKDQCIMDHYVNEALLLYSSYHGEPEISFLSIDRTFVFYDALSTSPNRKREELSRRLKNRRLWLEIMGLKHGYPKI